jgi:hypothetical protein
LYSVSVVLTTWYGIYLDLGFYNPASNANIPGAGSLGDFINTFAWWGLMFSVAGLSLSSIVFAFGRTAGNSILAMGGLTGLATSGLAAALIGGAQIWVNHLYHFGLGWH